MQASTFAPQNVRCQRASLLAVGPSTSYLVRPAVMGCRAPVLLRQPTEPASCSPAGTTPGRGTTVAAKAFNRNGGLDTGDRIIASLPYLLPLLDAFPFARFIMLQYPFIARAFAPLGPLMAIYHAFPFAPFLIFLAVYNGIVNNTNFSRFVRYNAMQAVLLDILLIIPQVILENVVKVPADELGLQAYITTMNTIFLFVAVCTAYGMGSCLVGQTPRLPLVAEAADSQMRGPF